MANTYKARNTGHRGPEPGFESRRKIHPQRWLGSQRNSALEQSVLPDAAEQRPALFRHFDVEEREEESMKSRGHKAVSVAALGQGAGLGGDLSFAHLLPGMLRL